MASTQWMSASRRRRRAARSSRSPTTGSYAASDTRVDATGGPPYRSVGSCPAMGPITTDRTERAWALLLNEFDQGAERGLRMDEGDRGAAGAGSRGFVDHPTPASLTAWRAAAQFETR